MPITVEAKESAGLEAGAYEGKILDLIEETGTFGEQVKFVIEVDDMLDSNGVNAQQWAWASKTLTPKSKLWKWIKNVTGQTPQIGAAVPIDEMMLGMEIGFLVSINDTGRSVVTDMFARRGAKPTARTAAPSAPAAASAPKTNAVAERLQAAPATEASDTVCCVPKCGRAVDVYDADGNAFCERHKPDENE